MGCRDALAPGGLMAVSTRYHDRVKNVALALRAYGRHYHVEVQHIRFFTDPSAARFAARLRLRCA